MLKKIKETLEPLHKSARGIHSEIHALAKDISEYCKEPKKFALYLGVIKRIGKDRTYQIFSEIKQSKNIKSPAKMFMFLSRDKKSMPILKIEIGQNNPILRKKSQAIGKIDEEIKVLAKNMIETLINNDGIGLAAPQIGKNIRLFVVSEKLSPAYRRGRKKQIFINPEIIKISKKTETGEEGCLSLPGVFLPIKRAKSIKMKALDENGKKFSFKTKHLLARAIQHELEHLDGILIVDKHEPR